MLTSTFRPINRNCLGAQGLQQLDFDLRLLCCGEVLCLAGWAGWTCLLRAGWDLLVSLPSLGMWHKRQLRWPCVQVSVCIPHAWWGWGWGLAVDRAGAPPSDLGTACVDLILAAPVGGTFGWTFWGSFASAASRWWVLGLFLLAGPDTLARTGEGVPDSRWVSLA